MTTPEQASRFRQRINEQMERLRGLTAVVQGRSKLLAGSLYQRRRRCGKRQCRCFRGELHQHIALEVRREGRSEYASVAGLDMEEIAELVKHWRQFRRARKEIIGIFNEILAAVDGLGEARQTEIAEIRMAHRG